MQRTPEPEELMDDPAQALAYASADFSEPNDRFVALLEETGSPLAGRALDLGCGPADIPLALLRRHPGLWIDAVDGARAMLALARERAEREPGPGRRLRLLCQTLPAAELPAHHYDLILSNSLLHHLRDPGDLWRAIARHGRPGARVLVMDLARPADPEAVQALVETHAAEAPEVLRRDFRNSLHAAYTVAEVREQLARARLPELAVERISDRHLAVLGTLPLAST